jgi:pre-mRNA-processing factor SLU7
MGIFIVMLIYVLISGQALPAELLFGQSDHYVEYDRAGNIIKGAEKPIPRSKYEEDGMVWL